MASQDLVNVNNNDDFAKDSSRIQLNKLNAFAEWSRLNRPAWQVTAAAVAPPVTARAGTASKVKTTATTQMFVNGVVLSLTATDNLWTLTGGNLAAGSVRRYLLLWDGTSATTVVSVQQCMADIAIATALAQNGFAAGTSGAALAACRFAAVPSGLAVVGILSIVNVTNAFVPGTTLLSATGVTDTYIDGDDSSINPASTLVKV